MCAPALKCNALQSTNRKTPIKAIPCLAAYTSPCPSTDILHSNNKATNCCLQFCYLPGASGTSQTDFSNFSDFCFTGDVFPFLGEFVSSAFALGANGMPDV